MAQKKNASPVYRLLVTLSGTGILQFAISSFDQQEPQTELGLTMTSFGCLQILQGLAGEQSTTCSGERVIVFKSFTSSMCFNVLCDHGIPVRGRATEMLLIHLDCTQQMEEREVEGVLTQRIIGS